MENNIKRIIIEYNTENENELVSEEEDLIKKIELLLAVSEEDLIKKIELLLAVSDEEEPNEEPNDEECDDEEEPNEEPNDEEECYTDRHLREEFANLTSKISIVERYIDTPLPAFITDELKNYFDTLVDEQIALKQLINAVDVYFSVPF